MKHNQAKIPKDSKREAGILFVSWCCAVADVNHMQEKIPKELSRRGKREAGILLGLCCD